MSTLTLIDGFLAGRATDLVHCRAAGSQVTLQNAIASKIWEEERDGSKV